MKSKKCKFIKVDKAIRNAPKVKEKHYKYM